MAKCSGMWAVWWRLWSPQIHLEIASLVMICKAKDGVLPQRHLTILGIMWSFWDVYSAVLYSTQTRFHGCKYFAGVELFQTMSRSSLQIFIALNAVKHLQQPQVILTASCADSKKRANNEEGRTTKSNHKFWRVLNQKLRAKFWLIQSVSRWASPDTKVKRVLARGS